MAGIAETTETSSNAPVAAKKRSVKDAAKKVTAEKARTILRDGTIRGKALTKRQRGFFGILASRGD